MLFVTVAISLVAPLITIAKAAVGSSVVDALASLSAAGARPDTTAEHTAEWQHSTAHNFEILWPDCPTLLRAVPLQATYGHIMTMLQQLVELQEMRIADAR